MGKTAGALLLSWVMFAASTISFILTYHDVNADDEIGCDGDAITNNEEEEDDNTNDVDVEDDEDEEETCQRQAPTLRQRQSQRACSQRRRPEL